MKIYFIVFGIGSTVFSYASFCLADLSKAMYFAVLAILFFYLYDLASRHNNFKNLK